MTEGAEAAVAARGRVREWQWMRGSEFAAVDRERTAVYVTLSPLEVHGPHLPVVADNFEAEALAARAFELLGERCPDLSILRLPPLFIAADVLPKPGSLAFQPATIVRVLTDLARTLSRQGFRHLWVGSFHGGPRHWLAIEKACAVARRRYGIRAIPVFSLLITRLSRGELTASSALQDIQGLSPEVLEGDNHAGVIETSLLLHLLPERVAADWPQLERRTLNGWRRQQGKAPVVPGGAGLSFLDVLRWLLSTMRYYQEETYAGAPGAASAEIGRALLDRLGTVTADALADIWEGRVQPSEAHTPLYRVRALILNRPLHWLAERLVGVSHRVF